MEITKALVIEDDGHGSTTSPAMVVFSIQPEPTTPSSASLSSSPRTLGCRDYPRRRPFKHVKKAPHNMKTEDAKHRPSRMSVTRLHRQRSNVAPMIHDQLDEKSMELDAKTKMGGHHADDT
jgi:hypothetical protein